MTSIDIAKRLFCLSGNIRSQQQHSTHNKKKARLEHLECVAEESFSLAAGYSAIPDAPLTVAEQKPAFHAAEMLDCQSVCL